MKKRKTNPIWNHPAVQAVKAQFRLMEYNNPEISAKADQVTAHFRQYCGALGIDLNNEQNVLAMMVLVNWQAAQKSGADNLGLGDEMTTDMLISGTFQTLARFIPE